MSTLKIYPQISNLTVGDTRNLTARICPANCICSCVHWRSSDSSVVFVNTTTGHIEARSVGSAVITACSTHSSSNLCTTLRITVSDVVIPDPPVLVSSITMTADINYRYHYNGSYNGYESNFVPCTYRYLTNGETLPMIAEVYPQNAANRALVWSSSDESLVSVDSIYDNGLNYANITASNNISGECTITAMSTDGSLVYAMIDIHVVTAEDYERIIVAKSDDNGQSIVELDHGSNSGNGNIVQYSVRTVRNGTLTLCGIGLINGMDDDEFYWEHYENDSDLNNSYHLVDTYTNEKSIEIQPSHNSTVFVGIIDNHGPRILSQVDINVFDPAPVSIDPSCLVVSSNASQTLSVRSSNGNLLNNNDFTWTSSKSSLISVGRHTGVITPHMPTRNGNYIKKYYGMVTVTATSVSGDKIGSINIYADTRNKIIITSEGDYFRADFMSDDGEEILKTWHSVQCDISIRENCSDNSLWNPDSYNSLYEYEQRFVQNRSEYFTKDELAMLYTLDPEGVVGFLSLDAFKISNSSYASTLSVAERLVYKDEIFELIFGRKPSLYRRLNGVIYKYVYTTVGRTAYFSEAELIFGFHSIFDWHRFIEFIADFAETMISCIAGLFSAIAPAIIDYTYNTIKDLILSSSIVDLVGNHDSGVFTDMLDSYSFYYGTPTSPVRPYAPIAWVTGFFKAWDLFESFSNALNNSIIQPIDIKMCVTAHCKSHRICFNYNNEDIEALNLIDDYYKSLED